MNTQFKKGVLELIVLSMVDGRDYYGFQLVSEISKDVNISEGTIYPLLKRLKDDGNLETYIMESASGPPRKYYKITTKGRQNKNEQQSQWYSFVESVGKILRGEIDE